MIDDVRHMRHEPMKTLGPRPNIQSAGKGRLQPRDRLTQAALAVIFSKAAPRRILYKPMHAEFLVLWVPPCQRVVGEVGERIRRIAVRAPLPLLPRESSQAFQQTAGGWPGRLYRHLKQKSRPGS